MDKSTRCLLIGLALGFGAYPATASAEEASAPRIAILIKNSTIPDAALHRARTVVTHIYAAAGVEVVWFEGYAPSDLPYLQLTLIVASGAMGGVKDGDGDALGSAAETQSGCGRVAYVRWNRIEAFARVEGRRPEVVLGPVIAHEIGHLLLSHQSHTDEGIMRARWQGADFAAADGGGMTFSPEQAARIRTQIGREPLAIGR
jgi:hypothetical protein